jgi:hypothetical protein
MKLGASASVAGALVFVVDVIVSEELNDQG